MLQQPLLQIWKRDQSDYPQTDCSGVAGGTDTDENTSDD